MNIKFPLIPTCAPGPSTDLNPADKKAMADEKAGVSLLPRDGRASGPGAAPAGGILRINEVPDETEPRPPCPGCCCRGPDWLINMYTPVASTRPWSPALSWGWIVVLSGQRQRLPPGVAGGSNTCTNNNRTLVPRLPR